MDTEQQGNNSWGKARQFGRDLKQHWQWMLGGTMIGCAVGSVYGGVAAPAAFGAGYASHGWIYVGVHGIHSSRHTRALLLPGEATGARS